MPTRNKKNEGASMREFLANVNLPDNLEAFFEDTRTGMLQGTYQMVKEMDDHGNSGRIWSDEAMAEATRTPPATKQILKQVQALPPSNQIWYAHVDTDQHYEGNYHTCQIWLVQGSATAAELGLCIFHGQWMSLLENSGRVKRRRHDAYDLVRDVVAQACLDPMGGPALSSLKGTLFKAKGTTKTPFPPQRPGKVLLESEGMVEYLRRPLQTQMGIPNLGLANRNLVESAASKFAEDRKRTQFENLPIPDVQNEREMREYTAAAILATDYVSEDRAPFKGWRIPREAQNIPKHWFVRPPDDPISYRLTDLWGWRTNLERSLKAGDLERAERIVQQHKPEEVREFLEWRIVLTKVAEKGQTEVCRFLLDECGVHVDGMQDPKAPRSLKANQIDAGGSGATTPLHRAAYVGRADTVRFLLQRGASVHVVDEERTQGTPLHHAVSQGHADCVRILVEEGNSSLTYTTPNHRLDAIGLSYNMAQEPGPYKAMQLKVQQVLRELDPRCSNCFADDDRPVKNCPCFKERYCSKECQKERWREGHKKTCKGRLDKPKVQVNQPDPKVEEKKETGVDEEDDEECCAKCGVKESAIPDGKLKACTRCYRVAYCGRQCQRNHWKVHKKECGEVKPSYDLPD